VTVHADVNTTIQQTRPFAWGWKIGMFRSRLWLATWIGWTLFFLTPLMSGWLLKLIFDALSTDASVTAMLVGLGLTEMVRWILFGFAIWVVIRWWHAATTMIHTNLLHAQTVSGGPRAAKLPSSPSEAISRFQQDTRDVLVWTDSWLDGFGSIAFGVVALIVMATINLGAALVALIPIVIVTVLTRKVTPQLHRARADDRQATSEVTSFLGEAFTGMLAFRLAGKEQAALTRLDTHMAHRRTTAVRDKVLDQTVSGLASATTDVTIGLTLLALVPAVRSGDFTTGDLALFVAYAIELRTVPAYIARIITSREQAIVSFGRLGELVAADRPDDVVAPAHVTVQQLTSTYDDTDVGIHDVSFDLRAGSFTVVTGGVGSGKSTLLRALVGLEPSTGSVQWNDAAVHDVAAWFVPPNSAFLPQVPSLFSESLADNICLGRDDVRLVEVLEQTTLNEDLSEMPDGARTTVGSRGLRLSGGQAQRVATARALLSEPELLVVDDLSSALDVKTERALWDHLRMAGTSTVIAVSHRQFVIDQADQVIRMEGGRIESIERRNPATDRSSTANESSA